MFFELNNKQLLKEIRIFLTLAIPLIASSTVGQTLGFTNTTFLAWLGQEQLAAGSIVSIFFATMMTVVWGTLSAINVLTSHAYGAKNNVLIARVLKDGLTLGVILSIPASLLTWFAPPLLILLGQKPHIVELATRYFHSITWAVLPDFIFSVFLHFLVGLGKTRLNLVFTAIWVGLTACLNYILMFGKFNIPTLGISGIGIGTAIAFWIMALLLGSIIFYHSNYKNYRVLLFHNPKPSVKMEILKVGLPVGAMYFIETGFFLSIVLLMGTINNHALAANQIVLQYTSIFSIAAFGFGQAATIYIGHNLGAKNLIQAERIGYLSMLLALLIMCIIAILYSCFPTFLIQLDFDLHASTNQSLINLTKFFFSLAAIFQIIEGIRLAAIGALRGWKDTRFSMISSTIGFWLIALPLGYILNHWNGWQGGGIWLGIIIGVSFNTGILIWRYHKIVKCYLANPKALRKLLKEEDFVAEAINEEPAPPHV